MGDVVRQRVNPAKHRPGQFIEIQGPFSVGGKLQVTNKVM